MTDRLEQNIEPTVPLNPIGNRARIVYFDHTALLGGGELAMIEMVRKLDVARFEPVILLGAHGPLETELAPEFSTYVIPLSPWLLDTRKDTLTISNLTVPLRALAAIAYIMKLVRFFRKIKPAAVHTNSLKADFLGGFAARIAGVPLVWHVRDRIDRDYLPWPAVFSMKLLCRWLPNYVVGCSQSVIDTLDLPEKMPRMVVYSGLNLKDYQDKQSARREPLVTDDPGSVPTLIGLVGRFAPWKGQHIFLQAAAEVHRQFPRTRFLLYGSAMFGETDYEQSLHRLVDELGLKHVVEFKGFERNIAQAIVNLDIVVHASTSAEPFGQVIVQGMAAGKPVIATEGGGASEIIRHGIDGLLVERGNTVSLANALLLVLGDTKLADSLAMQGMVRAQEKFTIERTVARISEVFSQVIGEPGPSTRVLFYNTTGNKSGAEVVLLSILRNLDRERYSISVACPNGPLAFEVEALGFKPIAMPELAARFTRNPFALVRYLGSLISSAAALRSAVLRTRPALIHANSIRAGIVSVVATWGLDVRIQWHIHDNLPPHSLSFAARAVATLSRRNRFIAVSRATAKNFAGKMFCSSIEPRSRSILNGINLNEYCVNPGVGASFRAGLKLRDGQFCIAHIGQITQRKDQLGAVRAFHQASTEISDAVLLIVGSPVFQGGAKYLEEIHRVVDELRIGDRVRFLGQRSDVAQILQAADLVLMNSISDPCPLTVLEAMASASAILASDVDGIPELIEDGTSGWLVSPGNPEAFARRMVEISQLPVRERIAIGNAARTSAEGKSIEHYMCEFVVAMEANLESSRRGSKQQALNVLQGVSENPARSAD